MLVYGSVIVVIVKMAPDTSPTRAPQVDKVAVKPPPFWRNDPLIWFAQLEAQFSIADITKDETKFYYVISAVDSEVLKCAQSLILQPPATDKYAQIKKTLIENYSESETSKVRTLLQGIELGDLRPSQLLSRMRDLASNHISDDIYKSLWLARLPKEMQSILAASNENLDNLAKIADKISAVVPSSNNSFIHAAQSNPTLEQQVASLTKQVSELTDLVRNSRSHYRTPRWKNNRSQSRKSQDRDSNIPRLCFYHKRFGPKAHKCTKPCSYTEPEN